VVNFKTRALLRNLAAALCMGLAASSAGATCSVGYSSEPSLQQSLDGLLGTGAIDVVNDCVAEGADALWTTLSGGATVLLEIAGNANLNRLGIYNPDTGMSREIFQGSDGVGSTAAISLSASGSGYLLSIVEDGQTHTMMLDSPEFGFYLQRGNDSTLQFFSDTDATAADPGVDHLYAYQGTGDVFVGGAAIGSVFAASDYILAWEDLKSTEAGYDRDYQDMVVLLRSIAPVPLPAAVWLLLSGLIGVAGIARRPVGTQ
jgi:hypothetical protein